MRCHLVLSVCSLLVAGMMYADNSVVNLYRPKIEDSYFKLGIPEYVNIDNIEGDIFNTFTETIRFDEIYPCPNIPFYTAYEDGTCCLVPYDEPDMGVLNKTKGDFLLAIVSFDSFDHRVFQDWIYSFDYNGGKIDSLCLTRFYESSYGWLSDQVSRIDQDLRISMSKIIGLDNHIGQDATIPDNYRGIRYDQDFDIDGNGHFNMVSEVEYLPAMYSQESLIHDKQRSIRDGNEQKK